MSQITISSALNHAITGLNSSATLIYTANEDLITSKVEEVEHSSVTTVDYGDVLTPKYLQLRLISGEPAEVSLDSGSTWPLRISSGDDSMLLGLNNSGVVEISTIEATSGDTDGNKNGLYFDVEDKDGTVRAYFTVPARAEVSTIQAVADSSGSLDGTGFILQDSAGSVGVWFDHHDSGTAAPADVASATRQIEITTVSNNDTADEVASAIATVLQADSAFSATASTDTVTVTDQTAGARGTDAADSGSSASGFTFATPTQGIDATTLPSTPSGGRLLAVSIAAEATALEITTAITSAFNGDSQFSASNDGVDTTTITDAHVGNRTNIAAGTSTFTVGTSQNGGTVQVIQIRCATSGEISNVLCTSIPE